MNNLKFGKRISLKTVQSFWGSTIPEYNPRRLVSPTQVLKYTGDGKNLILTDNIEIKVTTHVCIGQLSIVGMYYNSMQETYREARVADPIIE